MSNTLDYQHLISMAQANSNSRQREIERRGIESGKPKKLDPKQAKLKVGVQKFLAKKEEEEKKLKQEALKKKQMLLELRNQDRKATNRVRKMLNMTKSANKSCIADAQECLSDMCTEQAGEIQPDEDDYGYTSTFAAEMHKKMLQKYQAAPKSSQSSKKRVSVEMPTPKSLHSSNSSSKVNSHTKEPTAPVIESRKEVKKEPEKPKKKVAPPPTFVDLLRLAEQKSKEPVVIKKPTKEVDGPEMYEFGRPMTAKEKAKYLSEAALRKRVETAIAGNYGGKDVQKPIDSKAPKSASSVSDSSMIKKTPSFMKRPEGVVTKVPEPKQPPPAPPKVEKRVMANHTNDQNRFPSPSSTPSTSKMKPAVQSGMPRKAMPSQERMPKPDIPSGNLSRESKPAQSKSNGFSHNPAPKMNPGYSTVPKGRVVKESPPSKSHQPQPAKPSKAVHQNGRIMPSPHHQSRPRPPQRQESRPREDVPYGRREEKSWKGRAVIHSDESEYDSEMDDFIDDSDVPGADISSMIGQIFGYNKRKYNDISDDECMESTVAQQFREEDRSLRIGIQEDLEDIRREEEEKKRKAAFLKKKRKL